jgi:hypothetical protein
MIAPVCKKTSKSNYTKLLVWFDHGRLFSDRFNEDFTTQAGNQLSVHLKVNWIH